jgi:gas vesicle protein
VIGARDGRERYDAMKAKVTQLWEDPRVAKARRDVEAYARAQAPIIRERAEAAAKAAPGVAKDVAGKVADTAKDVASTVTDTAKDVADRVTDTAKDVADRVTDTAKDLAARTTATAKDAREQATKVAAGLRERGEVAVDNAALTAGAAREAALEVIDDEDEPAAKKD